MSVVKLPRSGQYFHLLDVLWVLVAKEMKAKYKAASLGYLWSVAQPLASALIFYFVFKIVIRINIENYPLFLTIGLFAWQWFAVAVNNSLTSLIHNASVIKKINFPRALIPASIVVIEMIHFIITTPVLIGMMVSFNFKPHLNTIFVLPAVLVLQFVFTLAVCLFVSAANLFFRDMERVVTIFMTLLFYLTPVVYAFDMVPARLQHYLLLNPMAIIVTSWRDVLLHGSVKWPELAVVTLLSAGSLVASYWVFSKLSPRFAELL